MKSKLLTLFIIGQGGEVERLEWPWWAEDEKENANDLPSMSQIPTMTMISTPEVENENQRNLPALSLTNSRKEEEERGEEERRETQCELGMEFNRQKTGLYL